MARRQERAKASARPVLRPWPPLTEWTCAASPARMTRPVALRDINVSAILSFTARSQPHPLAHIIPNKRVTT